jgi:hypothetical protein
MSEKWDLVSMLIRCRVNKARRQANDLTAQAALPASRHAAMMKLITVSANPDLTLCQSNAAPGLDAGRALLAGLDIARQAHRRQDARLVDALVHMQVDFIDLEAGALSLVGPLQVRARAHNVRWNPVTLPDSPAQPPRRGGSTSMQPQASSETQTPAEPLIEQDFSKLETTDDAEYDWLDPKHLETPESKANYARRLQAAERLRAALSSVPFYAKAAEKARLQGDEMAYWLCLQGSEATLQRPSPTASD